MQSTVIDIADLDFAYDEKQPVLKGVDLQVNTGDFLAIIGPNGGGKSTLLKLILGLLKPQRGKIRLFGKRSEEAWGKIGYVPQETDLNPHFPARVIDIVLMGHIGKNGRFSYSDEALSCAYASLENVGLDYAAKKKIETLSGGERQRMIIARALCSNPSLLILDEPTANIDPTGQHTIYDLLRKLNRTMTIVVVSHDLSLILEYANKVAYVNREITLHDISDKKAIFHTHGETGHFCEVELLQMLGSERCTLCEAEGGV